MSAGGGFAVMAWRLAWTRAMPMFPNEWRKDHYPAPRNAVDLVTLPASAEYYRIIDHARNELRSRNVWRGERITL